MDGKLTRNYNILGTSVPLIPSDSGSYLYEEKVQVPPQLAAIKIPEPEDTFILPVKLAEREPQSRISPPKQQPSLRCNVPQKPKESIVGELVAAELKQVPKPTQSESTPAPMRRRIPSTADAMASISKLSIMMRKVLEINNLWSTIASKPPFEQDKLLDEVMNFSKKDFLNELRDQKVKLEQDVRDKETTRDIINDVSDPELDEILKAFRKRRFYRAIGDSIYYSLLNFLGIVKDPDSDPNEKPKFIIPKLDENSKWLSTWRMIDVWYHEKIVSTLTKDPVAAINKFREVYGPDAGIDTEWLNQFGSKLRNNLDLRNGCYDTIVNIVRDMWCRAEIGADTEEQSEEPDPDDEPIRGGSEPVVEPENVDDEDEEVLVPEDNDPDDEEEEEDEDEEETCLKVHYSASQDKATDEILVVNYDGREYNFFVDLFLIDITQHSLDDVNGPWDWLKHLVPKFVVVTEKSSKFLALNKIQNHTRFVVIQDAGEEEAYVGAYPIDEKLVEDETFLGKIDMLFRLYIKDTPISHRDRTLHISDLIVREKDIESTLAELMEQLEEFEQEENKEEEETVAAETKAPAKKRAPAKKKTTAEATEVNDFDEIAKMVASDHGGENEQSNEEEATASEPAPAKKSAAKKKSQPADDVKPAEDDITNFKPIRKKGKKLPDDE